MYAIIPQQIPQGKRAEINEKILFAINSGKEYGTGENGLIVGICPRKACIGMTDKPHIPRYLLPVS